jgi:hypothetical protein
MLLTVYSLYLGHRPWIYFFLLSLVVVYIVFGSIKERHEIRNLSLILLILILLPATIYANNNFFTFGTDQAAHLERALNIVEDGKLEPRAKVGYYEPFPFLSVLLALITTVTGFGQNTYVFLSPTCSLLFVLTLYLLSKQIRKNESTASLAPLVILSVPPLAFILATSKYLSLIIGFICLYLVTKLIYYKSRTLILVLTLLLIAMVVSHASGPFFVLSLFLPIGLHSIISRNLSGVPRQFRSMSLLILVLMFTYWVFNHLVLLSVIGPTMDFFTTITSYFSGSPQSVKEAARPYLISSPKLVYVTFAWAFPPSFVAGYLIYRLQKKLTKQDRRKYNLWTHKIAEFGSGVGLVLILVSFLLAYYGTYSYLIIPAYAVVFFLMILLLPKLLLFKNEFVTVVTVLILAASLFIGISSPDWAPIENPEFPQRRYLYSQAVYTSRFGENLPQNVSISLILDTDVYPEIPEGVLIRKLNLRATREILFSLERGVSISELAIDNSTIFIIRVERLTVHGDDIFNLVRSSGTHVMIAPVTYGHAVNP